MPPLPPNVTKAGLLRSKSGWNNSSLSRRSGTTVGLLSTRTPHSSGNSGGGIPNPSLGIGVIREAMPRNAAGTWRPVSLRRSTIQTWTKYANGVNGISLRAFNDFGWSVAVSGSTIVVGAPGDDTGGSGAGAAWVSTDSGTSWTKYAHGVNGISLRAFNDFGRSVAVSGSTIVAGAPGDDTSGSLAGAAWVSTDSGANWTKYADGDSGIDLSADDSFGISVAVSGSTIVAGAPRDNTGGSEAGAVWVSTDSGANWTKYANGINGISLSADDSFGISVAVSGSTIAVGAFGDDTGGSKAGAAWVSTDSGANWTKYANGDNGISLSAGDLFGGSVAVSGSTIVAGATGDDTGGSGAGAVWVSTNSGTNWTKYADGDNGISLSAGDDFGRSMAVSGSTIVAGATGDDTGGSGAGAAWVSTDSGTSWTKYANGDNGISLGAGDFFGTTVAVSGSTIAVGAPGDDTSGSLAGAAWIFS